MKENIKEVTDIPVAVCNVESSTAMTIDCQTVIGSRVKFPFTVSCPVGGSTANHL